MKNSLKLMRRNYGMLFKIGTFGTGLGTLLKFYKNEKDKAPNSLNTIIDTKSQNVVNLFDEQNVNLLKVIRDDSRFMELYREQKLMLRSLGTEDIIRHESELDSRSNISKITTDLEGDVVLGLDDVIILINELSNELELRSSEYSDEEITEIKDMIIRLSGIKADLEMEIKNEVIMDVESNSHPISSTSDVLITERLEENEDIIISTGNIAQGSQSSWSVIKSDIKCSSSDWDLIEEPLSKSELKGDTLRSISETPSKTNLWDGILESIKDLNILKFNDELQLIISKLSSVQILALGNVILLWGIIMGLLPLIAYKFAEFLIDKYNIKERYPKMYYYIEKIRKIRLFYLMLDLVIAVACFIALLVMNILILFK
uniref:hypothetical protein n=1 Tax=Conidiobolus lichenicola TaxID=1167816 RepID=UPI001D10AA8A|nr:hypothetical protein LK371_mgp08 [Conidiobolus lichenicola]QZZ81321.1 hypothetical protein [Conidiobolus lichenicola]